MSFQVGFKSVGFFFVFKGNRIFDAPRTKFGCVQHIAFIVFFQTGFQVFGTANVKMSSACFINENVNAMKVRHRAGIVQNSVCGSADRVARLHLLTQITPRQSSPLGSLVNPFAAPMACRGEISAKPR